MDDVSVHTETSSIQISGLVALIMLGGWLDHHAARLRRLRLSRVLSLLALIRMQLQQNGLESERYQLLALAVIIAIVGGLAHYRVARVLRRS